MRLFEQVLLTAVYLENSLCGHQYALCFRYQRGNAAMHRAAMHRHTANKGGTRTYIPGTHSSRVVLYQVLVTFYYDSAVRTRS